MKIFIEKENRSIDFNKESTGIELLKELKINPSTVILVRNNEVVLDDEILSVDDEIKILSVISGG